MSAPETALVVSPRDTPSAIGLPRLTNVAVGHLGAFGVDVEVRTEPDGRIAVVLPAPWASLYLAGLQAQAATFREQLRKADQEARVREAERRAESGEALRRWEAEQAILYADYREFVAKGQTHREALHRLKRQVGDRLTITDLAEVIRQGGVRERRVARQERDRKVRALRTQGLARKDIGERLSMTAAEVVGALSRTRDQGGRDADAAVGEA